MYLRGEQVDAYIKDGRSQKFHCLVSHYPESTHHKILAVAARPYAKEDTKKGSKEYLFLLRPGVKDENILHCESEALTGALATLYPGESIAYLHDEVCPGSDCLSSLFTSDPIALFDDSGKAVPVIDIDLSPLRIRLDLGVIPTGEGEECTLDCVAKDFDCCSLGQCVRNGQPKEDAKDLPHYEEIVEEVLARPALASRYPEYFHLCAVIPHDDGTGPIGGGNTLSPEEEFRVRFQEKEDLYRCTTPHDGEAALCTVTFTATAGAALPVFQTGADDRNFQTIYQGTVGLPPHSVVQVAYGGGGEEVLEEGTDFTLGPGNDDLTQGMGVTLALPLPQQETLKIRYLVDGSCREVSRTLAKCSKYYVQGQNKGEVDDHFPSSNSFALPFYADTGKAIKATVASIPRRKGTHWELVCLSASLPCRVEFQSGHPVLDTEDVQLTFYVNTSQHPVSFSVKEAQKRIAKMCQCNGDSSCALRPMGDPVAVDYECDYTPSSSGRDPPLQKTVFVSAKTVPVRYYDQGGAYHATIDGETPPQEGRPFEYRGRNKLQPNNEEAFVGFNEIYGSLSSKTLGRAVPAQEVVVKKGVIYNIFVNSGSFATCLNCGTDYFSHMARIFPSTFQDNGRGYTPDDGQTNPLSTPLYRAHDLIFGRACFVPTPMIPWSHRPDTDADATVQRQRLRRLETQHFLQANGLGRDWYGFDYASLIGSFDGVAWFSIGSGGRRVKAKSNRLFLAVNAYFGDLTSENTYVVVISQEAFQGVFAPGVPIGVQQDFASDGAQCQRYHQCEHDDDCAANLGWEYTCEEVRRLRSRWPVFGNYAQESLGKEREGRLVTLFDIPLSGSAKRCVYRGRGGPCALDYEIANRDDSYAGVNAPGIHACTMNNSCQTLSGAKFNNKIRRLPYSVAYQNHNTLGLDGGGGAAHQFGLMSPIIGRPYDYNGSVAVDPTVSVQLDYNGIEALCLPGRNPEEDISHRQQNGEGPGADFLGDPVNALGMTVKGDAPSAQYLSSCSIFDAFGDYYHLGKNTSDKARRFDSPLDDALLVQLAGTQALPTNSLEILEDLIEDGRSLLLRDYFQSSPVNPVNALALQKNRCLRAPGSRCHTDIDCGPSPFISRALARLNPEEGGHDGRGRLNKYELLFWKEALVCGQREGGGGGGGDERVCCREDGKKLTIGTLERPSPPSPSTSILFENDGVPGVDVALNELTRYGRMAPAYGRMKGPDKAQYPPLEAARDDLDMATRLDVGVLDYQYNTLGEVANHTCCSGHWIREFHRDENGGGHRWGPSRMQRFNPTSFRCLNWAPCPPGDTCSFTCAGIDNPDDPDCRAKQTTLHQATPLLEQLGRMELLGIPQIAVKANHGGNEAREMQCRVNPQTQMASVSTIPGLIEELTSSNAEYSTGGGPPFYFSGTDKGNFAGDRKLVFSKDRFTCCHPVGTPMPEGANRNLCCTGFIDSRDSFNRCRLPDYANVSVYLNAYVSSEAKEVPRSQIHKETGFIKSNDIILELACRKQICASGVLAQGVALSNLWIPGHVDSNTLVLRYIDGTGAANNRNGLSDFFRAGLRWNTHLYCLPASVPMNDSDSSDIVGFDCR